MSNQHRLSNRYRLDTKHDRSYIVCNACNERIAQIAIPLEQEVRHLLAALDKHLNEKHPSAAKSD